MFTYHPIGDSDNIFQARKMIHTASLAILLSLAIGFSGAQNALAAPPAQKRAPASPDAIHLAQGANQFALALYGNLREAKEGNLFLSPASISTALAMTYGGAAGETAEQMKSVLHLDLPQDKLFPALSQLSGELTATRQPGLEINIANRLWGQKTFAFRPDYLKLTRDTFGAELATLDFAGDTEAARATINEWVAKQTKDKIPDLLPPRSINNMTRLVLTNAIYFKGDWSIPFTASDTKPAPFFLGGDKQVEVPLMFQQKKFRYHKADGVQLLELPYAGGQMAMVALLPEKPDGLAKLEANLTTESLQKMLAAARKRDVHVWLPKFKMASEFSLGDALQALGMTLAFDATKADFSGMSDAGGLSISSVVHKAVVDVNEKGTEAAAATGVVVGVTSARVPDEPVRFRADHPFIFLIRDQATGSIVFLGRVSDPTK
ncbi:MAG TPA: serpin family protein [Pirellulales bacterium]|jgi:serpin B